jgi:hypothetical protein
MLSYAESFAAGHAPTFYELEGLDDVLASEVAACDGDREDMGDTFDEYLAYQLEFVREVYRGGFAWCSAFSIRAPDGERGQVAISRVRPITRDQFERARERGWLERVSTSES